MNFILKGNSIYRLFFYIFYHFVSKSHLKNIKVIRNFLKLEMKRFYIGKIKDVKILFRFEDIGILRDIFIDKVYWMERLNTCKTLVDIGGHIGGFSLFVMFHSPFIKKIICIEPEKNNFEILSKNLKNFPKNIKITLLRIALSDKNFIGKLYLSEFSAAHSLEVGKKSSYQMISVKTLDDIVKENIDLVKIDAEGSEVKIIRGMKKIMKLYKPCLLIETGHFKNETQMVSEILKRVGYTPKILNKKELIIYACPRKQLT